MKDTSTTVVAQENHYYPFGLKMAGLGSVDKTSPKNEYLYNGKEMQEDFGLGWADYGGRFYNMYGPTFTTIDPHGERYPQWSPYSYCKGNPMNRVDPDGMDDDWWDTLNGSFRGTFDNATGLNTRATYTPNNARDYNSALDHADKTSVVVGAGMAVGGG